MKGFKNLATKHGVKWLDKTQVNRIFIRKNEEGNAEVVGVLTKDNKYFY